MSKYYISINPFAEFANATKASQSRIINQQITPNKFLIPWYQKAKSAIKKYFANINVLTPINDAIELLAKRIPQNKRQFVDKNVSIEALKKVAFINRPELLQNIRYDLISIELKNLIINDVDIRIAPDVIMKGEYNGRIVYGAIKFHVSKCKPFDMNQAILVSTLLYTYLSEKILNPTEIVLPELCLCYDVFAEKLVPAPSNISKPLEKIKNICQEIKQSWPKSA